MKTCTATKLETKGLPHNNVGEVDLAAYSSYLAAIRSGLPSDFENIILGGNTKLNRPAVWIGLCDGRYGFRGTRSSRPARQSPARSGRTRRLKTTGWPSYAMCHLPITRRTRRPCRLARS